MDLKLYKVSVSGTIYVLAKDEVSAADAARNGVDDVGGDLQRGTYVPSEVTNESQIGAEDSAAWAACLANPLLSGPVREVLKRSQQ